MPSLPSRGKDLLIALENVHKSAIKLSMESLILLDFVNLCQMFREGLFCLSHTFFDLLNQTMFFLCFWLARVVCCLMTFLSLRKVFIHHCLLHGCAKLQNNFLNLIPDFRTITPILNLIMFCINSNMFTEVSSYEIPFSL